MVGERVDVVESTRVIGESVGRYSSTSSEELIRTCSASGDAEAWEEFVRRFHRLIASVVLHTTGRLGDASTEMVDDLIQETYLKFCADDFRLLRKFDPRHPEAIFGYIKVVTVNVVRDHFKGFHSQKRGSNRLVSIPEGHISPAGENDLGSARLIERTVLVREVERHLDVCVTGPDRDRDKKIFWLYYRAGLSAGAIAALPGTGLSTKGVESIIFRVTKELRRRVVASSQTERDDLRSDKGILPAESF